MANSAAESGIRSKRVFVDGALREAVILIGDGVISGIVAPAQVPSAVAVEDFGDLVIAPGLVDSHVHINEPGRTDWEGFATATRAAAAGGITTVADMPLNSNPVTTTLSAFREKLDAARGQLSVDCAFFGGVVPGNTSHLEPMIEAGVVGFKCFLIHSGIDDFPNVSEADLHQAMPVLAKHKVPLLVHAELEHEGHQHQMAEWSSEKSYRSFLHSRPRKWENDAIDLMIELCGKYGCPTHIVHLSSSDPLPQIKDAIKTGKPFTVETCPHYLTFAAEDIPDADTRYKCAPPIRERENREKLWTALRERTIEIVVSDHSPCVPNMKFLEEGDLKKAWGGISSLQFRLPVIWTEARQRGFELSDVIRWVCEKPAKFLSLGQRKGQIAAGFDADFVVWDPDGEVSIHIDDIHHKHKVTPYEGRKLKGAIKATILGGNKIYENGQFIGKPQGTEVLKKVESRI